jgi:hypothetical protein
VRGECEWFMEWEGILLLLQVSEARYVGNVIENILRIRRSVAAVTDAAVGLKMKNDDCWSLVGLRLGIGLRVL